MATRSQVRSSALPRGLANKYRKSRSSLYAHIPTLEPMVDEETEEDEEGSPESPSASSASTTTIGSDNDRPQAPSPTSIDDTTPCYQISPAPHAGGLGVFATRAIPRGMLIFSEQPLFTQRPPPARTNSTIMAALAHRTREEQRQYFALSNAYKYPRPGHGALLPALGIFETNAFPCDTSEPSENIPRHAHEPADGVFLRAARFNHSCRPNVAHTWDVAAREMVFRALRDIAHGEELCVNYEGVDVLGTRKQRRAEALEAFGFVCACDACALEEEEGEESDRRRSAVRRLFEDVARCGKEPTLGMRKVKIALRLLKEEQLVHYEASFYFDAFQFCVLVSDFANAKAWARRAWEASCSTSGPDSAPARTFKMYWANPRTHQLAGMLPRMTLSGPD